MQCYGWWKSAFFLAYSALKFLLFTTAFKITKMSSHVPMNFKYALFVLWDFGLTEFNILD